MHPADRRPRLSGEVAALLLGAIIAALVGCGSSGQSTTTRPPGVAYQAAARIKAGTPRAVVVQRLGQPVLTSAPSQSAPAGCLYYAMSDRPLADVWEFCLDRHDRVNEGATLYAPSEPAPPQGASAARAVLVARGDAICQDENGRLVQPTKRLARLIKQLDPGSAADFRRRAAGLMGRFGAAMTRTHDELKAFDAPTDERSELSAYLNALLTQASALDRAAAALVAERDARYLNLRRQVTNLGDAAAAHARRYGFVTCSALAFS